MNKNVVDSIIASIIFALFSTGVAIILQNHGFSSQAAIITALIVLLVLMLLFIVARNFYPLFNRWLTQRLLENALQLNPNETDEAKIGFKKKLIEQVLHEAVINEPKEKSWITEFPNQEICEPYLIEEFGKARTVKILTIRGEKYFGDKWSLFYEQYEKRIKNVIVKVLVLSPESEHITDHLAREVGQHSAEAIKGKMQIVLNSMKRFASQNKNFEVRCYDETPNFKILLFDDVMFVSAFTEPKNDHNAKMIRITREGTPLFAGLEKHFNDL